MEKAIDWQVPLEPIGHWSASAVLRPLFGTMSYLLPAQQPVAAPVRAPAIFSSDEGFWQQVLSGQLAAGMTVTLDRFDVLDWFPRAPGLYQTPFARSVRQDALRFREPALEQTKKGVRREPSAAADYTVVLKPQGKLSMLEGGVGCVRLKPIRIDGSPHWLLSASSTGVAHAGVPIAVPQHLYTGLLGDFHTRGSACVRLHGELAFPPDPFTHLFDAAIMVPRLYLKVQALDRYESPASVSPEATVAVSFVSEFEGAPRAYATYVTFRPDTAGSFEEAVRWMKSEYVEGAYGGRIITDFDQTRTVFPEARLALARVMGRLVSRGELREVVELMHTHASIDQLFDEIDRKDLLPARSSRRRKSVFISYAHAAEVETGWVKRLRTHLSGLPEDRVDIWDDSRIRPGQKWRTEIDKALKQTRVAVLVLTADFLASEFIRSAELPALLEAAESDGATILCVYGSDVHLSGIASRLEQYQFVNSRNAPLQELSPSKREAVFRRLAAAVEEALTGAA